MGIYNIIEKWFLFFISGVQGLPVDDPSNIALRLESWKVIEEFYDLGLFKSIGVSNFNVRHLKELLESCRIRPHVNQVPVYVLVV